MAATELPSLEERIGTMVMMGIAPNEGAFEATLEQIRRRHLGGVILYQYNVADLSRLKADIQTLQKARMTEEPLFIAVDQEGGKVARIREKEFPSAKEMAKKSIEEVYALYKEMGEMVAKYGINTIFGPVVDLDLGNPAISDCERSYGKDPYVVHMYAETFKRAMQDAGIPFLTEKHFPGHGSGTIDTHKGIGDVSKTWAPMELDPYMLGHPEMVMVAHVIYDDSGMPSSLSPKVITDLLRKKMKFDGIVVSDDLQMGALQDYTLEEVVLQAILAGTDVLLFSNNPKAFQEIKDPKMPVDIFIASRIVEIVKTAIRDGKIPEERINESYQRIINFKKSKMYQPIFTPPTNFGERIDFLTGQVVNKPSIIVLHTTECTKKRAFDIFEGRIPGFPVSIHYIIDESGKIYKQVDEAKRAQHAGLPGDCAWKGIEDINSHSIGIEFVNRTYRKKGPDFEQLPPGEIIPGSEEVKKMAQIDIDGPLEWYPLTQDQIESGVRLIKHLMGKYDIKPHNIVGHSDTASWRSKSKIDPGPLFPWKEFSENGIGPWYDADALEQVELESPALVQYLQNQLHTLGYKLDNIEGELTEHTKKVFMAFQMHYCPSDISGNPNAAMASIAKALNDRYAKTIE